MVLRLGHLFLILFDDGIKLKGDFMSFFLLAFLKKLVHLAVLAKWETENRNWVRKHFLARDLNGRSIYVWIFGSLYYSIWCRTKAIYLQRELLLLCFVWEVSFMFLFLSSFFFSNVFWYIWPCISLCLIGVRLHTRIENLQLNWKLLTNQDVFVDLLIFISLCLLNGWSLRNFFWKNVLIFAFFVICFMFAGLANLSVTG